MVQICLARIQLLIVSKHSYCAASTAGVLTSELLQQVNSNLLASNVSHARMHFHRAPEVTRGGCLVKTRFGVIDARRETKIELLQKSLLA